MNGFFSLPIPSLSQAFSPEVSALYFTAWENEIVVKAIRPWGKEATHLSISSKTLSERGLHDWAFNLVLAAANHFCDQPESVGEHVDSWFKSYVEISRGRMNINKAAFKTS